MATTDLEYFYAFERECDEVVAGFDLWKRPLRAIVSNLFMVADGFYSGGRFGKLARVDTIKGGSVISRISYLLPLLRNSGREIGASFDDVLSVLTIEDITQIQEALKYAHLCELIPFVRNGYYKVARTEDGFRLGFVSEVHAYDEQRDIVASELSLSLMERKAPYNIRNLLDMAMGWPVIQGDQFIETLRGSYNYYLGAVKEDAYVPAAAYGEVFGFDRDEFVRVRAAIMALASWCAGMAAACDAHSQTEPDPDRWRSECLEWCVPLLKAFFVEGNILALSGVDAAKFDRIFAFFTDDPFKENPKSGDGYLAPFIVIDDSYLFSPWSLITMTAERNILYGLNKIDRTHFDNAVSHHLEPSLIDIAISIFSTAPGLKLEPNVVWEQGEVDLLVYDERTGTALQLQAKSPIPPQGARMTRQVEQNTIRAVEQLTTFENLEEAQKLAILNKAMGLKVQSVTWASGVLTRSSFGTSKAWASIAGRAALNPHILKRVVQALNKGGSVDLSLVPRTAFAALGGVIQSACRGWPEHTIEVLGKVIHLPLLDLDMAAIGRELSPG